MSSDSMEDKFDLSEKSYEDSWIVRFFSIKKNRYLERIQDSFLQDKFNFYGLSSKVENFNEAYLSIQDISESSDFENESIVYFLAHQRYIYTKTGMENILDKVLNWEFGKCCRMGCKDIPYLPLGLSNDYGKSETKVYCYNCENIYNARGNLRKVDGSAWGTSFAHFLILSFPYHFEKKQSEKYVPRIFGFQISEVDENDSS